MPGGEVCLLLEDVLVLGGLLRVLDLTRGLGDGPGQGGTLRRHGIHTRYDYEVPVGRCIDYLETRDDVDLGRIAVCGSSLGGYYAARAGACEHRLAAAISHGAISRCGLSGPVPIGSNARSHSSPAAPS